MRPGKAARTSDPILVLTPGALPCAQLTSPCTGMWEPMQRQGEHAQAKGGPQGARWEVPNRPSAPLQDLPQVQS